MMKLKEEELCGRFDHPRVRERGSGRGVGTLLLV